MGSMKLLVDLVDSMVTFSGIIHLNIIACKHSQKFKFPCITVYGPNSQSFVILAPINGCKDSHRLDLHQSEAPKCIHFKMFIIVKH